VPMIDAIPKNTSIETAKLIELRSWFIFLALNVVDFKMTHF
jgi:hypothetical protein